MHSAGTVPAAFDRLYIATSGLAAPPACYDDLH